MPEKSCMQFDRRSIMCTAFSMIFTLPVKVFGRQVHRDIRSVFVKSGLVDADLIREFPEAATIDENGVGWCLPPDAISPEAFGAVGDGFSNDRAAIQKAIDYAAAIKAPVVRFNKTVYAIWAPVRTSDPTVKNVEDGHHLVIRETIALVGRPSERTTLLFRNVDGRSFSAAWQIINGKVWRGAGIFLRGILSSERGGRVPPSITLTDLVLDGGCPMGRVFSFPARPTDGDGWDVTHKGLWAEEDRRTGDWHISRCTITRFRGELIYQGGADHGAVTMRDVEFSHTNADILNPCGSNFDVERGYFHHGFAMWEGWGGRHGRIVDSVFKDCHHGGAIQGGRANMRSHEKGAFTRPTPFEPNVKPWLTLDVKIINCGAIYIGSWVRGRIDLTDSILAISTKVFHNISDIDVDLIARCRTKSLPAALSVTGGANGQKLLTDVIVRLKVENNTSQRYSQIIARQGDTSSVRVVT